MAGATTFAAMACPRRQSADHGHCGDRSGRIRRDLSGRSTQLSTDGLYANWPVGLAPGMG